MKKLSLLAALIVFCSCSSTADFAADMNFLQKHTRTVVLESAESRAIVAPQLQGKIMTTSAAGEGGRSFGWINRELIASGKIEKHINIHGGEDRLWIGPEGGQFAVFFKPGSKFELSDWQTPAAFDSEPFELVSQQADACVLRKQMKLQNYSGTQFDLRVDRKISLLSKKQTETMLDITLPEGIDSVAVESDNSITNTGQQTWTRESGLLSIWILGMYTAGEKNTVVIPYRKDATGTVVKDDYFGKIPGERLNVTDKAVLFKGDAKSRGKIGINRFRATPYIASYDADAGVLTIVQYSLDTMARDYVNSAWEQQKQPYAGDVINSYNDGPNEKGESFGNFYELESSSAAAALKPDESLRHVHRTFHFQGSTELLNEITKETLGLELEEMQLK